MKFSAVIPVYNVEEYIAECIESILHQTYQDFEIILVDDGSTDNSGKICDKYALDYPDKIRIIHNKNQGQLKARNCGIRMACGNICVFIDSDDYIRTDYFEVLNKGFNETDCDVLLFNMSRDVQFRKALWEPPFEDKRCFSEENKSELYKLMVTTSKLNSMAMKAVKTDAIKSTQDSFEDFDGKNAEDLLQSLPVITKARKICYLAQNLYFYRPRPDSVVHTYNKERHKSIKRVHEEMEKYIDIWNLQELHGAHYAREVRGWVECLSMYAQHGQPLFSGQFDEFCNELADDEYFRNAYKKMEQGFLTKKEAMLAKWLYRNRFSRIKLMLCFKQTGKRLKVIFGLCR